MKKDQNEIGNTEELTDQMNTEELVETEAEDRVNADETEQVNIEETETTDKIDGYSPEMANDKTENKKPGRKKWKILAAAAVIILVSVAGGIYIAGNLNSPKVVDSAVGIEDDEEENERGESLLQYVKGIKNLYVEQNAEDIDWTKDVTFDKEQIKEVAADDEDVDLKKTGEYKLTYTVTGVSGEKDTKEIKVTVVDSKKAQELADSGKTVLLSKNEVKKASVDKSDSEKEEAAKKDENDKKDSETDEKKADTKSTSGDQKSDTAKESGNSNSNRTSASGNSGSSNSGNSGNTGSGSGGASGNTAGTGSGGSTQTHTHNWVAQTTTVHHEATGHYETQVVQAAYDEPIYESRVVCGCGATFMSAEAWGQHSIDGCMYGYSVQPVQVGTNHHDAVTQQVWVQDSAAWDETITTGYRCSSCGATK